MTSNYILLETVALIQNRIGIAAVRVFYSDIVPLLKIDWIDASTHSAACEALLSASRKAVSLVDCTSFAIMRRFTIQQVFTFDKHFKEQGFIVLKS